MVAKPEPTAAKTMAPIEVLGSILAFLRRQKLGTFGRFAGWGGATILALIAVVLVAQTQAGEERLQAVLDKVRGPQPQAIAAVPPRVVVDIEETRRLEDAVRKLAADRDRLKERIASLERNFDDMTGSIKTVMLANAAAQAVKDAPKEAAAAPAPVVSAPAAVAAPVTPPTAPVAAKAPEPAAPSAPNAEPATTEIVPLPPVRLAGVAIEPPAEPAKPEFGMELGRGATIEAIRDEWARVKANYGPLLAGLRPVAAPRQHPSGGSDYRLVVGPFPTAAAAAKVCAKFTSARPACRTARFVGEDVALK
jgi:hypothetical protein